MRGFYYFYFTTATKMSYNLVIVESASKSKTIQKYLNESAIGGGSVFKVVACFGHIIDLPLKTLGVNTCTWEIDYTPIDQKKKVIAQLKGLVKDAKMVYLAADPDREGEAIAWNLRNHLKLKAGGYKRITFHEITPRAIAEAMAAPRDLDIALINAQEARRALDRVVGYKVSPLLWRRFSSSGLSAGRVQSALLAEIVWRFKEFQEHQAEPFWTIAGYFNLNETALTTHLYEKKASHKMEFGGGDGGEDVVAVLNALNGKEWKLLFEKKASKQNPGAPYTTSALQQEAYEKYKIPAKQTMSYAQELYEKGLITYMRTDSVNLSADAKTAVHQYLSNAFDASYVVDRSFKSKVANAQEAHECIRPTNFEKTGLDVEAFTPGHCKVYDLIWRRSVASQMPAAEYMNYHFTLVNDSFPYEFRGKVSFIQTLGYLEIWQPNQKLETELITLWDKLAEADRGAVTLTKAVGEANITRPTGLYNEPMLIKWMEKEGIGRPSTYSAILEKLFQKGYITKGCAPTSVIQLRKYTLNAKTKKIKTEEEAVNVGGNGKEKDKFIPTSLGERIIDYLKEILPSLLDKDFTSHMEEDLDKISRSETTKIAILSEFYKDFSVGLEGAAEARAVAVASAAQQGVGVEAEAVAAAPAPVPVVAIIETRYGPAIYISATKKYISVTPFMEWKKLNHVSEITEKDIEFMCQLPQKYKDIKVEMGRYGLYLVYKKKNCRLPVEEWDAVYHHTITHKRLLTFIRE